MPQHVCNGATLMCSFGLAPSTFIVLPINRTLTSNQPAANIMDHVPMLNIMPFGMCSSPSNPTVAAATAAAMGVLTPMPSLNNTSKLMCTWAGVISVSYPGQMTEMIP